ncbi:hypothetical protein SAMN05421810_105175 [Amycolatopsis arida]|uniref:Uncharacterized protein n=1 Tax=Amycolatopsis arida TaxID=587909 RepID=A0A1I5WMN9_9PSEU|nr:hypothetical protein [Amycolatopsis arida]TDX92349.1 hypothetical protein CLV69_105194 [Amycolatopsis arida]SFQ20798.1 hypothetical protein SAMN05421810_105175 [Amycolatopsis arida]
MLAGKQRLLADQQPRCTLTRHAADLTDPMAHRNLLTDALAGTDLRLTRCLAAIDTGPIAAPARLAPGDSRSPVLTLAALIAESG